MNERTQSILFSILTFIIILTSGLSAYLIYNQPVTDIEIQSPRFEEFEIEIEPQQSPIPQQEFQQELQPIEEDDRIFHFKLGPFELNRKR
jgi:hypothetical protein